MPTPSTFFPLNRQAHRLHNVDIEHVQPIFSTIDLHQQSSARLADAHHAPPPDVDVVAHLVELPHTHDICREPRNVVDIIEGLVLTILAQEQNRTSALDSCHGVISEAH
jgi:hypothetical protein